MGCISKHPTTWNRNCQWTIPQWEGMGPAGFIFRDVIWDLIEQLGINGHGKLEYNGIYIDNIYIYILCIFYILCMLYIYYKYIIYGTWPGYLTWYNGIWWGFIHSISFLGGWRSIYQLYCCEKGTGRGKFSGTTFRQYAWIMLAGLSR